MRPARSPPGALPAWLLDTLGDALGPSVPVCGGLAADQFRFTETVQFCNGRVYTDAVPVLLFAGPLRVSTGVASGWEPVGEDHRVTRADGLVVSEINGEPPRD
ncbi:FIST N-terminal domain-containing protein, partial [Rubrivirga sp.]|uniref:FIST N-terminal domain-containing protein n=1 Tax=Rubrivirga sp. TaxID=1885344 RepID=UPI003C7170E4